MILDLSHAVFDAWLGLADIGALPPGSGQHLRDVSELGRIVLMDVQYMHPASPESVATCGLFARFIPAASTIVRIIGPYKRQGRQGPFGAAQSDKRGVINIFPVTGKNCATGLKLP